MQVVLSQRMAMPFTDSPLAAFAPCVAQPLALYVFLPL